MGLFEQIRSTVPELSSSNLEPFNSVISGMSDLGNEVQKSLFQLSYFTPQTLPKAMIQRVWNELTADHFTVNEIPYPYQKEHEDAKGEKYQDYFDETYTEVVSQDAVTLRDGFMSAEDAKNRTPSMVDIEAAIHGMFNEMKGKRYVTDEQIKKYNDVKEDLPFYGEYVGNALASFSARDTARFGVKIEAVSELNKNLPIPDFMTKYPFGENSENIKGGWIPCTSFTVNLGETRFDEIKLGNYSLPYISGRDLPSTITIELPELEGGVIEDWKQSYYRLVAPVDSYPLTFDQCCYRVSLYSYNRDMTKCYALQFAAILIVRTTLNGTSSSQFETHSLEFKILGHYDESTYFKDSNITTNILLKKKEYKPFVPEKDLEVKIEEPLPPWIDVALKELEQKPKEDYPTYNFVDKPFSSAEMQQNELLIRNKTTGNSTIVKYIKAMPTTRQVSFPTDAMYVRNIPSYNISIESTQWGGAFCSWCLYKAGLFNIESLHHRIAGWAAQTFVTKESKPRLGSFIVFGDKDFNNLADIFLQEGHVGIVLGGNKYAWYVLSGCQNDEVNITKIGMTGDGKFIRGTKYKLLGFYYPKMPFVGTMRTKLLTDKEIKTLGYNISTSVYFK